MIELQFLGAARTVTGSMHLLRCDGRAILLDCGLFQGRRAEARQRNRTFPFDPRSIDAVILSHAHIDHSGNLPGLVKAGFRGPIFCTGATRDLCRVMLADSGFIHERDAEFVNKIHGRRGEPLIEPLYTALDAEATMEYFRAVGYNEEFAVVPNVTARLTDAGHILGSASVHLTMKHNGAVHTLGFTGDVGRRGMPIIRDPVYPGDVETLISESTYGGILHEPPENMAPALGSALHSTISRGGKIIVPAFSVGRTQELVFTLHKLYDNGTLPQIPIYVDSPLSVNATEIFKQHPECFDDELRGHILRHHDPFGLSGLRYVRTVEESKQLNDRSEPCMIISASGMCEAGRILHHLANTIHDPRNTVLIVGYQADHTLGKKLVDRWEEVKIFGEVYKRRAEVVVMNAFSAHADGRELADYIGQFDGHRLERIFLVHGEYERQVKFGAELERRGLSGTVIPVQGQHATL